MARFPRKRSSASPSLLAMSRRASTAPGSLPQAHDRVQDRRSDRHLRNFPPGRPARHRPGPASHCAREKPGQAWSRASNPPSRTRRPSAAARRAGCDSWDGDPPPRAYLSALPGQPASLKILDQSPAAVTLAWRKRSTAGPVRIYRWSVGTAARPLAPRRGVDPTNVTIKGEPGIECEYRVIAKSKKGEGTPSNVCA